MVCGLPWSELYDTLAYHYLNPSAVQSSRRRRSDIGPAQQVVNEIKAAGGEAIANGGNVASWEGANQLFAQALEAFGDVDAVINNAGILRDVMFHRMTETDWDTVAAVNLKGCFNVARAAAVHFKEKQKGAFVHMTSSSGLIGNFGSTMALRSLGLPGCRNALRWTWPSLASVPTASLLSRGPDWLGRSPIHPRMRLESRSLKK